jgi:hypothetical protein
LPVPSSEYTHSANFKSFYRWLNPVASRRLMPGLSPSSMRTRRFVM